MENLKILSRGLRVSIDELLRNKIPLEKKVVKEKEVTYVHNRYTYEKWYHPKLSICGIPLVDINVGGGRTEEGYWRVAKGIIAIGNVSVGAIFIGLLSMGLCSPGLLTLGLLFAIGPLALSHSAIGCPTIGHISIGAIAIGVYSIGVTSIGFKFTTGTFAYGEIAMGTNSVGNIICHLRSSNTRSLGSQEYLQF